MERYSAFIIMLILMVIYFWILLKKCMAAVALLEIDNDETAVRHVCSVGSLFVSEMIDKKMVGREGSSRQRGNINTGKKISITNWVNH